MQSAETGTEVTSTHRHGAFLSDKENVSLSRESRPSDGWLGNRVWICKACCIAFDYLTHGLNTPVANAHILLAILHAATRVALLLPSMYVCASS